MSLNDKLKDTFVNRFEIFEVVDGLVDERLGLEFAVDGDFIGEIKVSEFKVMLIGFLIFLYPFDHIAIGYNVIECIDVPVKNLLLNLFNAQMLLFLFAF
jgi:hypothetical protein